MNSGWAGSVYREPLTLRLTHPDLSAPVYYQLCGATYELYLQVSHCGIARYAFQNAVNTCNVCGVELLDFSTPSNRAVLLSGLDSMDGLKSELRAHDMLEDLACLTRMVHEWLEGPTGGLVWRDVITGWLDAL